ncbi:MAG: cell division protein FtsZ [Rhodospirillales bacterium]|nr:cell division protein FtsZ [Alphaproteobacteria bacterium]MCB9981873.1 cell division protein FtsZ [Rhodospirillales bacterium]
MAINIAMQPTEVQKLSPRIIVAGMGGAGGNAVNNMISSGLEGCEFLVCNTDAQALENSLCNRKVQLGAGVTGGLGAGSKPEVGKAAAEESIEEVMQYFEGANMAFITAGMGGGTGTGAAPVVAKACRERGILTVGVVTKPFHFEGSHRMKSADAGIEEIQDYVDTLIVIPNQNLFRVANEKTTFADAFQMADSVLQAGVRGVTDLMVRPGLVNLDFADIRTAMLEMGKAMMGTGEAEGDKRAIEAAESAINNPLLDDVSMKGAHGVIINVTGGYDMTLFEADEACNRIRDEVDPNANIIFGATFDESLEGKMRVSIVATGIDKEAESEKRGNGGTGGFTRGDVNARTKIERATPNTGAAEAKGSIPGATQKPPTFMSAESVQAIKAPPVITPAEKITAAQGAPQMSASREMAVDMFEQREFADVVPDGKGDIPQNTALRGTLYKDSFIPPKPAEVSELAPSGAAPYISSFRGEHVPQAEQQTVPSASGLKLNPPKMPNPEHKKRSPSLFERISGTVQEHLEGMSSRNAHETTPRHRMAPTAGGNAGLQPMSKTHGPSQGSLNIDSPSKPASGSDENLDIPAFLRRQAN